MTHEHAFWEEELPMLLPIDLDQKPVYIVSKSEAGPGIVGSDSHLAVAFTSTLLDFRMRPSLEAQGRWRGPGYCIVVINSKWLTGRYDMALSLLIHELGHAIESEALDPIRWEVDFVPQLAERFVADQPLASSFKQSLPQFTGQPAWCHHELNFTRAAAHLYQRARRRERWIPQMFAGDFYRLSEPEVYSDRLADEFKHEADTPIVKILRKAVPASLEALWRDDTQKLIVHKDATKPLKGA